MLIKVNYSIIILFVINFCFSQNEKSKFNDDGLTRLTFGIHKSFYKKAEIARANPETNNIGSFELSNSQGFFINFKILKYKNSSIKVGLFLNSLQHELWYRGNITDINSGNVENVSSRPDPFAEKMLSLEYCLDYSYLIKVNEKLMLDLSFGLSQERNQSYERYSSNFYFSDENLNPYQEPARSIYFYKSSFLRTNYAASLGYKIDEGMINFGVKYSVANKEVSYGQYEFFEPNSSDENQGYGFFNFSGNYLSATLSFTPSKSLFKRKK